MLLIKLEFSLQSVNRYSKFCILIINIFVKNSGFVLLGGESCKHISDKYTR